MDLLGFHVILENKPEKITKQTCFAALLGYMLQKSTCTKNASKHFKEKKYQLKNPFDNPSYTNKLVRQNTKYLDDFKKKNLMNQNK